MVLADEIIISPVCSDARYLVQAGAQSPGLVTRVNGRQGAAGGDIDAPRMDRGYKGIGREEPLACSTSRARDAEVCVAKSRLRFPRWVRWRLVIVCPSGISAPVPGLPVCAQASEESKRSCRSHRLRSAVITSPLSLCPPFLRAPASQLLWKN